MTTDGTTRLASIHLYPIKSCRGTRLGRAHVGSRGLQNDRRWMLVDEEGRFLSQRNHPRLALVRPTLEGESLRVEAPGMVPLELDADSGGSEIPVGIWRDRTIAEDLGDRPARWFSDFLGPACRLVRQAPGSDRNVVPPGMPRGAPITFADGYPFLLTGIASLEALNRRLPDPVPMDRFRPNLVVETAVPFVEDTWRRIRIGALPFAVVKPCARCVVTTVDQATGQKGREPLRTLASFRRGERGVLFGQNLVHMAEGPIRVGAVVEVLETGPPPVRPSAAERTGG